MEMTSSGSGHFLLLFWLTLLHIASTQLNSVTDSDEFCEWESFNATCRRDEVVLMKAAKYGRMRLGKCVTKNYGHIGCGTDVMPYMEERCSGRMSCLVSVISLHNKRSCPKDFKSYLQASYECLQVAYPSSESCRRHGFTELTRESGYISNAINSLKVGWVGRERSCSWRIVAEPYQRINLTLTDYAENPITTTMDSFDTNFAHSIRCGSEYALVVDKAAGRNSSICASKRRTTNVYLSRANVLEVFVTGSGQVQRPHQRYFLIKYEAIGCPPVVSPMNAWVKADHEHAIIQCNETEEAWFLSCKGTKWVGHVGNCSHVIVEDIDWTITDMFQGVTSFPFGLLIVVALGVAIGVAIGLVMLVSVLVYMKRRRRRRVRSRSNYLLKTISQENAENQCKANADSVTDCSPMLVKRDDLGYTPKEQYYTTWQHQRSLGLPVLHGVDSHSGGRGGGQRNSVDLHSLEGVDQDDSTVEDLVSPEGPSPPVLSHYHTLPRSAIGPIFTTFKPGKCPLDGDCSPTLHRSSDCVIRTCDEGPYYFKLDHVNSVNKDDDAHKPDLVPGCLECQAQERTQNHHSVV